MPELPEPVDPRLKVEDFDYELPHELIAQTPLADRTASRMLVLDRESGSISHSAVKELARWLDPGDLLVANNSRVLPARLHGVRADTNGRVELLLLRREREGVWSALAKPARRLRSGITLRLTPRAGRAAPEASVSVIAQRVDGEVLIQMDPQTETSLDHYGSMPLPPYIRTALADGERYQTVYASDTGSAAAPTAGLHFTAELIRELMAGRLGWAEVTLHVGLDTFRPVTENRVADHVIHSEWCTVTDDVARKIGETKRVGNRVVAIGTTAARTLETLGRHWNPEQPKGISCMTDIFITPGYRWAVVDAMLTNFHLPRSTLLMMVSSFAGSNLIREAYQAAIAGRYRFYSFGDAMLIR